MEPLFEYLTKMEKEDNNFRFGNSSGQGLFIAYNGYKHMNLLEIREVLSSKFKLKFDYEKGLEEFDQISGKTFVYFKNVYNQD